MGDGLLVRNISFERSKSKVPKSFFEIEFSRKVGCVLISNEVHFVSLADNFIVQFSNILKLSSGMENKTA